MLPRVAVYDGCLKCIRLHLQASIIEVWSFFLQKTRFGAKAAMKPNPNFACQYYLELRFMDGCLKCIQLHLEPSY